MKKTPSIIIITVIYVFAFLFGIFVFKILPYEDFTLKIILADITATVFVWLLGVILKNSSVYDPYWSVAPMVIFPFYAKTINFATLLMLSVIMIWGIRLTINWAYGFQGLKHQDWRYTYYKTKFPRMWPLVNFFGINMMPTLIVISVMIPGFKFLETVSLINIITAVGVLVCIGGILLELFADIQMHRFRKLHQGQVNRTGLWKYSRHPNYLGEILMWWGIYIMMASITKDYLPYILGPIANTLLFVCISIPLMEKRQAATKPQYSEYQKTTSMLLLLPSKRKNEE